MQDHVHLQGIALNASDGAAAPDWVQLTPSGALVGRDGRAWTLPNPEQVVAAFRQNGADLPVDLEHATQLKGAQGEAAPAIGWIKDMQVRNGQLWGRVEWTEQGEGYVKSRAYRYLSPVFTFAKATGEVVKVISAGLTNLPNLKMAALNREGEDEEKTMLPEEVTKALGLAKEASDDAAVAAINRMKTPDAEQYVPKATHEQALNRAETAEAEIARMRKESEDAAINAALDAAITAGKIAPADREFYEASCRTDGGLERFAKLVEGRKAMVDQAKPAPPPTGSGATLTAEEQAVCRQLGLTDEEFLAQKDKEAV